MIRQRRNFIGAIRKRHEWITKINHIGDSFVQEFWQPNRSSLDLPRDFGEMMGDLILSNKNAEQMRVTTVDEIKPSVWSLHLLRA